MNYPGAALPPWEYRETRSSARIRAIASRSSRRSFLEQFDWGSPQFYIENSLIDRPMIYGLLGASLLKGRTFGFVGPIARCAKDCRLPPTCFA